MQYTKNIQTIDAGRHTYKNEERTFGSDEGLCAFFEIEKCDSLEKIYEEDMISVKVDTNFIRVCDDYRLDKVAFISHTFNISDTTELMKALEQEENKRILQLYVSVDCLCSISISIKNVTGRELFELMRGHIALLYSLHHEMLEFKHISEDSHRPAHYIDAPIAIYSTGLEFKLFDPLCDEYDLIDRITLLRNMYESARSGEPARDFINRFFKSGEFEKYTLNRHNETFKKIYKSLALKFMRCMLNDKYEFNIGNRNLLHLFYNDHPQDEKI